MKVFSEETIFHRTVWTTADNFAGEDRAHSPCPPSTTSYSHDNSSFNRNFDPVKKILAPPSTLFARDCSGFLLRPTSPINSIRPISPPGSPSPLSAFKGFGFGPHGGDTSQMGFGTPGGEKGSWDLTTNNNSQRFADEPIKLAPIRLPFDGDNSEERLNTSPSINLPSVPMHVDSVVKQEKETTTTTNKERKIGVTPVSFKKQKKSSPKNAGKVSGILVVQTTTTTTTTPNNTTVVPPAQFSQSTTSFSVASLMNHAATNTTTTVPQQPQQTQHSATQRNTTQRNTTQHNTSDNGNRRRVTPEQLAVLEREFECGMIPDLETRKRLAKKLGFTERRVQVWFQNRRAKMKKDNHSTPIFIINCGIDSFKN